MNFVQLIVAFLFCAFISQIAWNHYIAGFFSLPEASYFDAGAIVFVFLCFVELTVYSAILVLGDES